MTQKSELHSGQSIAGNKWAIFMREILLKKLLKGMGELL